LKINKQIVDAFDRVRVVGTEIVSGEISAKVAWGFAKDNNMDLVCVNDVPDIPICKIFDIKKKKFEAKKKQKENKPSKTKLKTIQLGLDMSDNDRSYRVKNAIKFIEKKNQVKITLLIKGGRNMARGTAVGGERIKTFVDKINSNDLTWSAEFVSQPKMGGNTWTAIIVGKKKKKNKNKL